MIKTMNDACADVEAAYKRGVFMDCKGVFPYQRTFVYQRGVLRIYVSKRVLRYHRPVDSIG